jgi:hypothetical protein
MACCGFPLRLKVDLTGLSGCSACVSGGNTAWDGMLRDHFGTRCVYLLDNHRSDNIGGKLIGKLGTQIRRNNWRECIWNLHIQCGCYAFESGTTDPIPIWQGHLPAETPFGLYRVVRGCHMNVETVEVEAVPE